MAPSRLGVMRADKLRYPLVNSFRPKRKTTAQVGRRPNRALKSRVRKSPACPVDDQLPDAAWWRHEVARMECHPVGLRRTL